MTMVNNGNQEQLATILANFADTVKRAFESHINEDSQVATNVGRFKWQYDKFTDIVGIYDDRVHTMYEIERELKRKFNLNDDDLSDISNDHENWLDDMAHMIYENFADYCKTAKQYDDNDEWLDFLQSHNELLFVEQQYIDCNYSDLREQYRPLNSCICNYIKERFAIMDKAEYDELIHGNDLIHDDDSIQPKDLLSIIDDAYKYFNCTEEMFNTEKLNEIMHVYFIESEKVISKYSK